MTTWGPDSDPTPSEIVRFSFDPIKTGRIFGPLTDVNGQKWDANGCSGGRILLRPDDGLSYNTSSDGNCIISRYWRSHSYEVVAQT